MTDGRIYKKQEEVGKWRLQCQLGVGGQGQVWKVRHASERHSPPAALKICTAADEKAKNRFAREIATLQKQTHPGLVAVRDAGQHEGVPFFVMELANASMERLVTGDSAGVRLLRASPSLLLTFFRQACEGVAHLHQQGVLHRDIKPSNILLMLEPPEPLRAVVADLGIAVPEADQGTLTNTHEVVGSPVYRAPESLVVGAHTPASDVYSLGKTLEFLFTRSTPSALGPGRCLRGPELSDDLWTELDGILSRACAFEPGRRFSNANDLVDALPEVVLVKSRARLPETAAAGDISLGWPEARVLAALIGECPTEHNMADASYLARKTRIGEYRFSMALRELQRVGFAEVHSDEDFNGNQITLVRPSPDGVDWARTHPDEMEPPSADERAVDDDIPF